MDNKTRFLGILKKLGILRILRMLRTLQILQRTALFQRLGFIQKMEKIPILYILAFCAINSFFVFYTHVYFIDGASDNFLSGLSEKKFSVDFLYVGQGDATLMRSKDMSMLVDAGPPSGPFMNELTKILGPLNRRIDVIVATHPDADHIGGFKKFTEKFSHGLYIKSFVESTTKLFEEHEKNISSKNMPYLYAYTGMRIVFSNHQKRELFEIALADPSQDDDADGHGNMDKMSGGDHSVYDVQYDILFPDFLYTTQKLKSCLEKKKIRKNTNCKKLTQFDTNEMSVVMNVRHGKNNLLLTGDASKEVERYVYENNTDLFEGWRSVSESRQGDLVSKGIATKSVAGEGLLKLGHHGSKTSTDPYVVEGLRPSLGISSSGKNNKFQHPDRTVLDTLESFGVDVLRTDVLGSISVMSDGLRWVR
jgi:beta-lactamase superfamily II metal-dependent hydrolase